jgi:hypothetical protein
LAAGGRAEAGPGFAPTTQAHTPRTLSQPPTRPPNWQATVTEPFFTNARLFWAGATQVPLNYFVPLKHALFYHIQIGFYLQVGIVWSG